MDAVYIVVIVILSILLVITVGFLIRASVKTSAPKESGGINGDINNLRLNTQFMHQTEIDFMNALLKVLPRTCLILAKVPLRYLAVPTVGNVSGDTFKKAVDFCIFNQTNMMPLLVIDLYDATFEKRGIDKQDADVDRVLKKIGLSTVTISTEKEYDKDKIRQAIISVLSN